MLIPGERVGLAFCTTSACIIQTRRSDLMKPDIRRLSIPISQLVLIDAEPSGQYTARAVGLPEIRASAATREEAIEQVRSALQQSLAAGHLVPVQVSQANPQQQ